MMGLAISSDINGLRLLSAASLGCAFSFGLVRFCRKESRMRNRQQNGNREKKSVLATPLSISKHPSTQRSVYDEFSSSTQASVVSQSPQAKKELFFSFPPPNQKALKHPRWWNAAAAVMGSALVWTMRVDQSGTLRRGRTENSSLG